jgi:zinc protease
VVGIRTGVKARRPARTNPVIGGGRGGSTNAESMLAKVLSILAGAILMATIVNPVEAGDKEPQVTTLSNGFTVLVQEDDRFPLVSFRLYVHAGSAFEEVKLAGISHLLEHMVFKGTEGRGPGDVAAEIEGAGGSVNAATSFDYTVYTTDLPATRWKLGMDVVRDMVFGATIEERELELEKDVVVSELHQRKDRPQIRLFERLQGLIFADTPYARPLGGTPETVQAITRKDILEYVHRLYQPQSMLLAVVGKVNADEVLTEAEVLFGGQGNDRSVSPPRLFPLAAPDGPVVHVERGPWNKIYLGMAFPVPGSRSPDSAGLEVLSRILGGGKSSRLYRKFKYELGLVDDISVSTVTMERLGMLYLSANLDPARLEVFWPKLIQELAAVSPETFTDEELDRAKLHIEDDQLRARETLGGLASKLGYYQFFENGLEAEELFLRQLASVDRKELSSLAGEYLRPGRFRVAALQPSQGGLEAPEMEAAVRSLWPSPRAEDVKRSAGTKAGKVETVELGKGRTLVLLPDKTLPYVALDLVYAGGDTLLSPDEQGLAELAARTLIKGTASKSATEIQDFLADRASALNADGDRDLFTVSARYPARFGGEILPLFREALESAAFAEEEVEREKRNQTSAIKTAEDQPLGLAFRRLFPFLFRENPYGYYHLGQPEMLAAYSRDNIRTFWEKQRRQPWTMAVCGDFDRKAVLAMARDLAGKDGDGKKKGVAAPLWSPDQELDLKLEDRNQAHLLLLFKVPPLGDPDTAGLRLLRTILAGQGGLLFRELRDEQGLGYTVTAFLWQRPEAGFLAFYIGTTPDKTEQALEGFRDAVEALRDTELGEGEVERGKSLLTGDYYHDHQTLGSRSREAAVLPTRGFKLDMNRKMIEAAQKLTAKDLMRLARSVLVWDERYLLRVLP